MSKQRSLLNEILKLHDANDIVKQGMASYSRSMDLPDFKFFRDMLLTIKGTILADMFSSGFTELDANEKDVQQRTYFHLNQWLDFMIAPQRYINQRKAKLQSHAERLNSARRTKAATGGERSSKNE